jgi:hypothetical protein
MVKSMSARIIWRSAAPSVEFVDPLTVLLGTTSVQVGQVLSYDRELASRLHAATVRLDERRGTVPSVA